MLPRRARDRNPSDPDPVPLDDRPGEEADDDSTYSLKTAVALTLGAVLATFLIGLLIREMMRPDAEPVAPSTPLPAITGPPFVASPIASTSG